METRTVTDSGVQVALDDESLEGTTAKRMKKEAGVTGKSVVVLRGSNVIVRNDIAFMPNTIEMAQIKKREKGQFKTNVQFCSKMTELDVKKLLMDTFPYLENQRFYCAAAADNRTRLDFHGQPRIWDGQFIKRKIKGNSALYILTDEQESGDGLDSKVPEQVTLKRSHDQITSPENEMPEQSLKTGTKSADTSDVLTGFQAAIHGSSILTGASAEGSTVLEKSEKSQQIRCFYVPVTAPHDMSPVLCPSISATHDTKNGKDVVVSIASLSQSLPLVMVPDSAVQSGAIPKARISTASDQQCVSKTADGSSITRQAGQPLTVHKMPQVIHSMLTPGMDKLHISSQSSGQLQKTIYVEKTVLTRDQSAQTIEGTGSFEVGVPVTTTSQGDKSLQVELVKEAGTRFQQGARIVLSDLPSQSTDDQGDSGFSEAEEKGVSRNRAAERPPHMHLPLGISAGQPDSGIETSEDIEANPLNLLSFAVEKAEEMRSETTQKKSVVEEICPSAGPLQGGTRFLIVFSEHLQPDVESGFAVFGYTRPVTLRRLNEVNMTGRVPAASAPGTVAVRVYTSRNEYLGVTHFTYVDEGREALERFLQNERLWPTFFSILADKMRKSGARVDEQKETFNFSGFKETNTELARNNKAFCEELLWHLEQVLDYGKNGSSSEGGDITNNRENGSGYFADDERSDSTEDGDYDTSVIPLSKTAEIQNRGLQWGSNGITNRCPPFYQQQRLSTQHTTEPLTLQDPTCETSSQSGDSSEEASNSTGSSNRYPQFYQQQRPSTQHTTEPLTLQDPTCETLSQSGDSSEEASNSTQMINFMESDVPMSNLENFPIHAQEGVVENAVVTGSDSNPTDADENSEADKSRRAQYSRRMDEMDDSPAAGL